MKVSRRNYQKIKDIVDEDRIYNIEIDDEDIYMKRKYVNIYYQKNGKTHTYAVPYREIQPLIKEEGKQQLCIPPEYFPFFERVIKKQTGACVKIQRGFINRPQLREFEEKDKKDCIIIDFTNQEGKHDYAVLNCTRRVKEVIYEVTDQYEDFRKTIVVYIENPYILQNHPRLVEFYKNIVEPWGGEQFDDYKNYRQGFIFKIVECYLELFYSRIKKYKDIIDEIKEDE